jgi:hypothetical protein
MSVMTARRVTAALGVAALAVTLGAFRVAAQLPLDLPPGDATPAEICGTGQDRLRQLGLIRPIAIADGQGLSYQQDPPVLFSDFTGTLVLRDFLVAGDVPTIRFKPDFDGSEVETWQRVATRQVGGRLVSVFEPSWPTSVIDRVLVGARWGWDQMAIYWGELLPGGVEPGSGSSVWVRMAPTNLPRVDVRSIGADVQYSSHVVNLVISDFGDGHVDDEYGFDLVKVTSKFYQSFADSYDSIAIVPERLLIANYSAFHRNVQNAVRGIGMAVFDDSATYGSQSHRLRSVELYASYSLTRHSSSTHEISHQWGAYIDWARLTGLTRAGHSPDSHDPLWTSGETFVGAVLTPFRRVRQTTTGWEIERTPGPARLHPYSLYAMGHVSKEQVPEIRLFDRQDQFDARASSSPAAGMAVTGATRMATIYNVIGMLGERSGPVDSEWHRATVIVSRDRVLSPREMDYWTFAVRRLEDPNGAGVIDYDGLSSFDVASGQRIDLRTDIRPLAGGALAAGFEVDYPTLGSRDWRDVVFDTDVATHYRIGQRVRWSGVVSARDRNDFHAITIRLWKNGGTMADAIRMQVPVTSRSSFVAETQFQPGQAGTYLMEVFLFWPDSGTQFSRAALSPIVID